MSKQAISVAILAYDGVILADIGTPLEIFSRVKLPDGRSGYELQICGEGKEADAHFLSLSIKQSLKTLSQVDTIIVPGRLEPHKPLSKAVLKALRQATAKGKRVVSICSGAFVLAEAGLLDGKRATTHWLAAPGLQAMYPNVDVDPEVLYVDNGNILTSAGAAAGIDLCLHLVKQDWGAAVAREAAKSAVVPLQRSGGQSQFIQRTLSIREGALAQLQEWVVAHPAEDLSVENLADRAAMSVRTLHRRFVEETGLTPAQWVLNLRLHFAQELLETSELSIDQVAAHAGFGSAVTMRQQFRQILGVSPKSYRASFS